MPFCGEAVTVSLTSLGTCSTTASSAPWSGITSYLGRRRASTSVCLLSSIITSFESSLELEHSPLGDRRIAAGGVFPDAPPPARAALLDLYCMASLFSTQLLL